MFYGINTQQYETWELMKHFWKKNVDGDMYVQK